MRCNGGTVWTIYKESVMRSKVQKSPHLWVLPVGIAPRCRRWPRQLELTLDWTYSLGPGRLFLSPNGFSNYLFLSRGYRRLSPLMLGIRMMAFISLTARTRCRNHRGWGLWNRDLKDVGIARWFSCWLGWIQTYLGGLEQRVAKPYGVLSLEWSQTKTKNIAQCLKLFEHIPSILYCVECTWSDRFCGEVVRMPDG